MRSVVHDEAAVDGLVDDPRRGRRVFEFTRIGREEALCAAICEFVCPIRSFAVLTNHDRGHSDETKQQRCFDRDVDHRSRRPDFCDPINDLFGSPGSTTVADRCPVQRSTGGGVFFGIGDVGDERDATVEVQFGNRHERRRGVGPDLLESRPVARTVMVHVVADHTRIYPFGGGIIQQRTDKIRHR